MITIFQEKTIDQKNELKKMIENIVVRGSTNLADGLKKGIDLLNETKFRENSNTRLKRLFLFSDGLINEGSFFYLFLSFYLFYFSFYRKNYEINY